jgi:hypothetical protein
LVRKVSDIIPGIIPPPVEPDVILRETFTLPLHAALLQARKIIEKYPARGT